MSDQQPDPSSAMTPEAPQEPQASDGKPSTWWQWFLLYPALAIALFTAVPDWLDSISEVMREWRGVPESTELVRFMQKNPECVTSPVEFHETDFTKVDGTICNETGDVWLRIVDATGRTVYKGIFIDEILEVTVVGGTDPLGLAAHAATPPAVSRTERPSQRLRESLRLSQLAVVVCQSFNSNGTITRHLREGNTCYDEIVNGSNGVVISRDQVACRSSCN